MLKMSKLFSSAIESENNDCANDDCVNDDCVNDDCANDDCDYENEEYAALYNNSPYDHDLIDAEIQSINDEFNFLQTMNAEERREAEKRHAEVLEMLDEFSHQMDLLNSL